MGLRTEAIKEKTAEEKKAKKDLEKKIAKFRNPFKSAVRDKGLNYAEAHLAFWKTKDNAYALKEIGLEQRLIVLTIENVIVDYKIRKSLR